MRKCKNCQVEVESDGHGDLVHVREDGLAGTYGCNPRVPFFPKDRDKPFPYPVAE